MIRPFKFKEDRTLCDGRVLSSEDFEVHGHHADHLDSLRMRDLKLAHKTCWGAPPYSCALAFHGEVLGFVRGATSADEALKQLGLAYDAFRKRTGKKQRQNSISAYLNFCLRDSGVTLMMRGVSYLLADKRLPGTEVAWENALIEAWTGMEIRWERDAYPPKEVNYRKMRMVLLPRQNIRGLKSETGL